MSEPHDPGVNPEDEGIPDLQDGTPQARWASDPQQQSVPVDRPVASDKHGTTTLEQLDGEPLEEKLREEEPETDGLSAESVTDLEAGLLSDDPLSDRPVNQDIYSETSWAPGLSAEESAVHVTTWAEITDVDGLEEVGATEEPDGLPGDPDVVGESATLADPGEPNPRIGLDRLEDLDEERGPRPPVDLEDQEVGGDLPE